jgi:hypothetical protein
MPAKLKKGAKIYVCEGPFQGARGVVTQVQRVFDEEDKTTRWTVWADDLEGGERIKTRLNWVRELES